MLLFAGIYQNIKMYVKGKKPTKSAKMLAVKLPQLAHLPRGKIYITAVAVLLILFTVAASGFLVYQILLLQSQTQQNTIAKTNLQKDLEKARSELSLLQNEDQYKINQEQQEKIKNIETTYKQAASAYEQLADLKINSSNTGRADKLFAESLQLLANQRYAEADTKIREMTDFISQEKAKITAAAVPAVNLPRENTPPVSGYRRQSVQSDKGSFTVDIIAADLNSTRVAVDTASDSDCRNDCPVLALADYVSRSGAFAGVNGTYFCPATYPSCAGKTNSFDLLVMNKNKKYLNSDNNVYSNNPAVAFYGNTVRFMEHASDWGRDTGVDAVISNFPLLVRDGKNIFGGSDDPKFTAKGNRAFVAGGGNTVYIGVVYNCTMAESAATLAALGLANALNLDDGGSTALWSGGYKTGPGRNLPNVVLFLHK